MRERPRARRERVRRRRLGGDALSEVIESFIREHPDLDEGSAFERFLEQDRISSWVGKDANRKERIRREFTRVWAFTHGAGASAPRAEAPRVERRDPVATARQEPTVGRSPLSMGRTDPAALKPSPPRPEQQEPTRIEVRREAAPSTAPAAPRAAARPPTRHLSLLCPTCERTDVWATGADIHCRHCGTTYADMLQLIPVKKVGTFAYLFGEGPAGYLTAAGVALLLLLLYGVVRWV